MTGQQIIDIINDNALHDFEMLVNVLVADQSKYGVSIRQFTIDEGTEIGHSDKVAIWSITERN